MLWPAILVCTYILATAAYLLVERPSANLVVLLQKHMTQQASPRRRVGGAKESNAPFQIFTNSLQAEGNGFVTVALGAGDGYGSVSTVESPPS